MQPEVNDNPRAGLKNIRFSKIGAHVWKEQLFFCFDWEDEILSGFSGATRGLPLRLVHRRRSPAPTWPFR